jgi:type II secretory pathway component PulM
VLPFATPALPLDEAGKYVAGAYIVFLVLVVVYVAIMAAKLQRIERELRELATFAETRSEVDKDTSEDAATLAGAGAPTGQSAPGRGIEGQSISVSSGPRESEGGGV